MSAPTLDTLVSLCKRRGFVYPSSEIYGGFAAVYDYGPLGELLKTNIANAWKKEMVQRNRDIFGLDAGIFMHPKVWKASGHVDSFDDPQIDCKQCQSRYRADHILEKFGIDKDRAPIAEINSELEKLYAEKKVVCEKCGSTDFTLAKQFNLLVKTNLGSPTDALTDDTVVYPRGETCQGIYTNFENVRQSCRAKVPFGIAQVGKAFRNEIVARQWIFRTREFEQMEMQLFVHPDHEMDKFKAWREKRYTWYTQTLGFDPSHIRIKPHEKLAHYAKAAEDIEYDFTALGGFKELEGVHARGEWDLGRHSEFSGEKLDYFDEVTSERYIPHVVETSVGLNRLFLACLHEFYEEEKLAEDDTRVVLRFPRFLAPIKVAILPLSKKPQLQAVAEKVYAELTEEFSCEYDETGSIGKRYRRQDEIGTPLCITIDFGTVGESSEGQCKEGYVTIRDRDSLKQEEVPIEGLRERVRGMLEKSENGCFLATA